MSDGDNRTRADIAEHGCTVIHVLGEGDLPPFAYSVGISEKTGRPEVIVIGLKRPMAHFVVNEYNTRVRTGEIFEAGKLYAGFLEGFDVMFKPVPPDVYPEYLGHDLAWYGDWRFKAVQLVYPATDGVWPWAAAASQAFRERQPVLARIGRG